MAGVLGITRMTRSGAGQDPSMKAVEIPAAIDTITGRSVRSWARPASTSAMFCGFTARIARSASRTAIRLSAVTVTPQRAFSSSRLSSRVSLTVTADG